MEDDGRGREIQDGPKLRQVPPTLLGQRLLRR